MTTTAPITDAEVADILAAYHITATAEDVPMLHTSARILRDARIAVRQASQRVAAGLVAIEQHDADNTLAAATGVDSAAGDLHLALARFRAAERELHRPDSN
jgi:hypothetical protein